MRMISLRAFAAQVSTITEKVEVTRRDRDGNILILGFWTPYVTQSEGSVPPEPRESVLGRFVREPGPRMVSTPQEAAEAVAFGRSQPAPKPTKRG